MPTNTDTPIDLPAPIAAYFAADGGGVASCFIENAVVVDERREHHGRQAIGRWKTEATAKYHYTSEPLAVDCLGRRRDRHRTGHRRIPRQSHRTAVSLHARGRQNCQAGDHGMIFDLELTGRRALVTAGTKGSAPRSSKCSLRTARKS